MQLKRQHVIAVGFAFAAILVIGYEWQISRNDRAADQDSLKMQLKSGGIGVAGPGGMPNPQQMQVRMLDDMSKELALNDDQRSKVGSIQKSMFSKMDEIFRNDRLSQQQKMASMQQMQQGNQEAIKLTLTPDQQTKYDAMQKRMRDRMAAPGGGPMGGGMAPPGALPMGGGSPNSGDPIAGGSNPGR